MRRTLATALMTAVMAASCGSVIKSGHAVSGPPQRVLAGAVSGDGTTLLLTMTLPDAGELTCWAAPVLTVTSAEANVSARQSRRPDCAPPPWRVPLPEPLAGRPLRDATTHADVPLFPVPVPEPTWMPDGWTLLSSGGTDSTWRQSIWIAGTLNRVEITLESAGPDPNLLAAVITTEVSVQGRAAAFVKPRYVTRGPDWLVVADPTWRIVVWSASTDVTADTLLHVANGLQPIPLAAVVDPPAITPARSGTIAELAGYEGPASVTGWLTIAPTGPARFCARLTDKGECRGTSLEIDWTTGHASQPTDLTPRGEYRVSPQAITLDGTLKGDILFVGL